VRQLHGLAQAALSLREAGCTRLYVDGSFVTSKEEPGDFDACWDEDGVDRGRLDGVILDLTEKRAAQQAKFGGALFPAHLFDQGSGMTILESYQIDPISHQPKGIVMLNPLDADRP
jgi:hypothetical protein